jgi:hypothetical protein
MRVGRIDDPALTGIQWRERSRRASQPYRDGSGDRRVTVSVDPPARHAIEEMGERAVIRLGRMDGLTRGPDRTGHGAPYCSEPQQEEDDMQDMW